MPVIATLPGRPRLVASPREVERVFDVALAELADPAIFHEERWQRPRAHHPGESRQLVRGAVLRGLRRDDLGRHRPHALRAHQHRRDRGDRPLSASGRRGQSPKRTDRCPSGPKETLSSSPGATATGATTDPAMIRSPASSVGAVVGEKRPRRRRRSWPGPPPSGPRPRRRPPWSRRPPWPRGRRRGPRRRRSRPGGRCCRPGPARCRRRRCRGPPVRAPAPARRPRRRRPTRTATSTSTAGAPQPARDTVAPSGDTPVSTR